MSLEDLLKQHYANYTQRDWDGQRDVFSPEVVIVEPTGVRTGFDAFIDFQKQYTVAFPDSKIELVRAVESGDTVMAEGVWSGTHTGPMTAPDGTTIPPTGKQAKIPFTEVEVVRDGKVVESHLYFDMMAFMGQLGLMPAASMG